MSNTEVRPDPMGIRPENMEFAPQAICPMEAVCKGAMENRWRLSLFAIVPGVIMVLVGSLVLARPEILRWLLGGTSIVLGVIALALPLCVRRMAAKGMWTRG